MNTRVFVVNEKNVLRLDNKAGYFNLKDSEHISQSIPIYDNELLLVVEDSISKQCYLKTCTYDWTYTLHTERVV